MHQAKRQFLSKQLREGFDFFEGGQEEGVSMRKAKAAKLEYPDYSVAIDTIDMHCDMCCTAGKLLSRLFCK